MDLQPYVELLRRRMWVVIVTCVVTLAVVALGSQRMTRIYSAASLVRVAQPAIDAINYNDLSYTTRLIQTYAQLLKSRPFLDEVIKRLRLSTDLITLNKAVKVEPIANTELIRITVESADPAQAAAIANTLGGYLVEQGQQMYTGQGKSGREILQEQVALLEQQLAMDRAEYATAVPAQGNATPAADGFAQNLAAKIRAEEQSYALLLGEYDKARVSEALQINSVSVVEPAIVPVLPSKPNLKLNLALGFMVGLLGGVGLALLLEKLDPTIHAVDDLVTKLGARFLARIPELPQSRIARPEAYLLAEDAAGPGAEAFLMLSASITSQSAERIPRRSLVVTSAEPGAGKSTVTVNLAAMLAESGREVIIVDGDMRNPSVHRALGLSRGPGLSDALAHHAPLEDVVRLTHIPRLRAVTAGAAQANPGKVWQASPISELVALLAMRAEIVIWDTPPVLAAPDALFLAPVTKAVLFVVARDQSKLKQAELALAQLRQVGSELVGVVYNRAAGEDWSYYDYYHRKGRANVRRSAAVPPAPGAATPDTTFASAAPVVPMAPDGGESVAAARAQGHPVVAKAVRRWMHAAAPAFEEPIAAPAAPDEVFPPAAAAEEPAPEVTASDVAWPETPETLAEPLPATAAGAEVFAPAGAGDEVLAEQAASSEPLPAAFAEPSVETAAGAEPVETMGPRDGVVVVSMARDGLFVGTAASDRPVVTPAATKPRQSARTPASGRPRNQKRR